MEDLELTPQNPGKPPRRKRRTQIDQLKDDHALLRRELAGLVAFVDAAIAAATRSQSAERFQQVEADIITHRALLAALVECRGGDDQLRSAFDRALRSAMQRERREMATIVAARARSIRTDLTRTSPTAQSRFGRAR